MSTPLNNSDLFSIYPVEVLQRIGWTDPVSGKVNEQIQGLVDQFTAVLPFRAIAEPKLQVPRISFANTALFVSQGGAQGSTFASSEGIDFTFGEETFEMQSISTLLRISSSSLGTHVPEQKLQLLIQAFAQALQRFLSVGVIYGGYPGYYATGDAPPTDEQWRYYLDPIVGNYELNTWDQSKSFNGFVQSTYPVEVDPPTFSPSPNGFYQIIGQEPGVPSENVSPFPIALDLLDDFIQHFRGANNGHIDYLVMNSALRRKYLELWRTAQQLPEYLIDPMTGHRCLAHDGVPILTNDYIVNYQHLSVPPTPNPNANNPENVPKLDVPVDAEVTSLYAVVCGEENGGVFGIFPQSFGSSPMKIEKARSSEENDTIFLRGMVEAGLAFGSRRGVGRLAGILLSGF
jgi:hypothetical protein